MEETMKLSTYFGITGVVAVLFGLAFILIPELSLKQYGVPTEPHNLMQSRYFGSALLAFGLVPLLGRSLREDAALRAILQASAVGNGIGAIISAMAVTSGLQNQMAWGSVLIYGVFFAGSLYYLSSPARRAQARLTEA